MPSCRAWPLSRSSWSESAARGPAQNADTASADADAGAAINDGVTTTSDGGFLPKDVVFEALPSLGDSRVVRVNPWPGRGVQLAVEVDAPAGTAISLHNDAGISVPSAVEAVAEPDGLTIVLIVPDSDPTEHATRVAAASALIAMLPARERTLLSIAKADFQLAADFTVTKAHLLARLAAVEPSIGIVPDDTALDAHRQLLATVGGPWGAVHRDLVVVGAGADGEALGKALEVRRNRVVLVGTCPDGNAGDEIELRIGAASTRIELPKPLAHMLDVPCDSDAAAKDDYPFGNVIDMAMTLEQRALHDQYHADRDESMFRVAPRIGPGMYEGATAHFRGRSSLKCSRKSYSINLDGGSPRRLTRRGADDEMFLISLCLDDHYYRQLLSNQVLRRHGLFPLEDRLVHLVRDGVDQGPYLLLEKPREAILRKHAAIAAIIRRRFEPKDQPEDVKYPKGEAAAAEALAAYEEIAKLVASTDSDALWATLSALVDMESYLRWLAFNTYMQSGDYADEVYFYASAEATSWYFRVHAWDSDDLFRKCHYKSKYVHDDPAGIVYCSEGDLDKALFASAAVYERFLDALEAWITSDLSGPVLEAAVAKAQGRLFAVLQNDATCAAMTELVKDDASLAECNAMRAEISADMDTFLEDAQTRGAILLDWIGIWRSAPQGSLSAWQRSLRWFQRARMR